MNILAIETSCDETGICLLEADGDFPKSTVSIKANELASQVKDHQEYGGVFPSLAKRLHAQNIPTLLENILKNVETQPVDEISREKKVLISDWLKRHPELPPRLFKIIETHGLPELDRVAVTVGPGLEPALWVGLNVARAIALISDIPLIPVNHMEGHLVSTLAPKTITEGSPHSLLNIELPAIALLVSGGHTELIKITDWDTYEKIGQTRDDAAGEAFDKIGRLLGLPYPAGPYVSRLARGAEKSPHQFPRPMLHENNLDFSFSGLKTAAARLIEKNQPLSEADRAAFAHELESAIVDVLVQKTQKAIKATNAKTVLLGGGVSANEKLRQKLQSHINIPLKLSPLSLAGDNAVMIALAALNHYNAGISVTADISVDSRLSL